MKLKQIRVDGYKNLVECKLDLGDFNVLVGPNNSGKSNFLEAIQMLWPICFGDDKLRKFIFKGRTPPYRKGSSVCRLSEHKMKPLKIGIAFETDVDGKKWNVDYEVKIQCDEKYGEEGHNGGFISEHLIARNIEPSRPGPDTIYIEREEKQMKIGEENHSIAKDNSSLLAIRSIYPDYKKLPVELGVFINNIYEVAGISIFNLVPEFLRNSLNTDETIDGLHISTFDLALIAEDIKNDEKNFNLFKETFCDILDFDDIGLTVVDRETPLPEKEKKEAKKYRFLYVTRKGILSFIEELSDGTLSIAAMIASFLHKKSEDKIMIIEEPENYLHPAALEKMLRFFQDNSEKRQVLITTHSPYLLNGVNPSDVSVAVVDENGASHFVKVENSAELRKYLNKGLLSFGDLLVRNYEGFREG